MNANRNITSLTSAMIALLALGLALRTALFAVSVRVVPAFDDECKIALQAKQIAHGEFPLLILASPYIFPLDAYLMAPFVRWLPRNAFGARVMAFGFGLITVIISILILRRLGPLRNIWPGVVLVALPSAYLLMLQAGCALPGYPTLLLLSALCVWLTSRHTESSHRLWPTALAAGLTAGLAASETLLTLPILLVCGAVIGVARSLRTAAVSAPAFGAGALAGFLPHLAAKHLHAGAFQAVSQKVGWREAVQKFLSPTLDRVLPAALGWGAPVFPDTKERLARLPGLDPAVSWCWLVITVTATLLACRNFVLATRKQRWPTPDRGMIFVGISWLSLALFLFSHRSHSHTYRYLVPVVWSFPFLYAYTYAQVPRSARLALTVLLPVWLVIHVSGGFALLQYWTRPGFADRLKLYDLKPVFQYLDQRGINRCYATYADAYRITFETDERIICSQPYNERFPGWPVPYKELVDTATNVAYVLSDTYRFPPEKFEEDLEAAQVRCRREICGRYKVYTDFESTLPQTEKALPPNALEVVTSDNSERASALSDGNPLTRWRTRNLQQAGMWIELRLRQPTLVSRLSLYYNGYRHDRAEALRLLADDGAGWRVILDRIPRPLDRFEFLANHPVYGNEMQTVRFEALLAHRLRLEIAEPVTNRAWTIGEIRLYSPN